VQDYLAISKPKLGDEEVAAVRSVLESGWLTQGPWVKKLEVAFADRHGVRYALASSSCTTALHLALIAAGVSRGDEVIVPAFTWIASANVVVHCGATPIFIDIRPDTYNIDPEAVRASLTPRTRAIIAVHLFGLMADMRQLLDIVPVHIPIIEDAACAAGASLNNRPAGCLGRIGCFSFHPRKSITCGEGGIVVTGDKHLAQLVDAYRNHGADVRPDVRNRDSKPYELPDFRYFGFNYRLTDIQAAIAFVQLQKLDTFIAERKALALQYDESLRNISWLKTPARPEGYEHALQSYVVTVQDGSPKSRDAMLEYLHSRGIGARPGTHSVVGLSAYRERFKTDPRRFPVATWMDRNSLALPLHNNMNSNDAERVVYAIKELA
jgi:dTDP-4-amino-4,6-dideoxygalactose transaminase